MGKKLIVSTVGTSLLTNLDPDRRELFNRLANSTEEELSLRDKAFMEELRTRGEELLGSGLNRETSRCSAELNGIYNIYKGDWTKVDKLDVHILVGTDTYQGTLCANSLRDWLSQTFDISAFCVIPPGLSTKSSAHFQHGMSELTATLHDLIDGYKRSGYQVIFNLVGGFKSLHGFMTALGMFYADKIIYIFEGEERRAITIPKLPITIDQEKVLQLAPYFAILEHDVIPHKFVQKVDPIFLETEGASCILSAWGQLIWKQIKTDVFQGDLLDFPRIKYADSFRRDYEARLEATARIQLQQSIAKASATLITNPNPISALGRSKLKYDRFRGSYYHQGMPLDHFRTLGEERIACILQEDTGTLTLLRWYTKNEQETMLRSFHR